MKKEETKIARYLTKRNATVLFLIAATTLIGQTAIQILVANQRINARTLSLAGRQRMLSQKIAKAAEVAAWSPDAHDVAASKSEIVDSLVEWETAQAQLHAYVIKAWFISSGTRERIKEIDRVSDTSIEIICAATRRLISAAGDDADKTIADALATIRHEEPKSLLSMESYVLELREEYDDWNTVIRLCQLGFVVVVLFLLYFQWRYLLVPSVRRVNDSVIEFEKLGTAVENASDHIIITDEKGIIEYANSAAERITGFSKKEMIGKRAGGKELWGGLMGKEFYEKLWRTISVDKKVWKGRMRNRRKDGSEYVAEVGLSPILGSDGEPRYFVGIERDITKEVQIDRAKTEFVSMAAHQLRTPIATTKWYLEMLLDGDVGKLRPKQKEYLEEVDGANGRMGDIVDDFLNVSRIELGTFQIDSKPIPFSDTIRECAVDLKPDIEAKGLKMTFSLPEKSFVWNADKGLLIMIVGNLISNAVKYTPEGGSVSVKVAVDRKTKKVTIEVTDSGIGIPSEQQGMIFSKMFRADNAKSLKVKGTGLGLYIVKSVVETAGGSISFRSAEGKGTTFTVVMPLSGMKSKEGTKRLG